MCWGQQGGFGGSAGYGGGYGGGQFGMGLRQGLNGGGMDNPMQGAGGRNFGMGLQQGMGGPQDTTLGLGAGGMPNTGGGGPAPDPALSAGSPDASQSGLLAGTMGQPQAQSQQAQTPFWQQAAGGSGFANVNPSMGDFQNYYNQDPGAAARWAGGPGFQWYQQNQLPVRQQLFGPGQDDSFYQQKVGQWLQPAGYASGRPGMNPYAPGSSY